MDVRQPDDGVVSGAVDMAWSTQRTSPITVTSRSSALVGEAAPHDRALIEAPPGMLSVAPPRVGTGSGS
jgi:hypothetical protein